jgi:hypothetical protein
MFGVVKELTSSASEFGAGNAAEWAGALVTFLLLVWTQRAWRKERQYARELESNEQKRRRREAASRVAAWVQRVTPALREEAALPVEKYRTGTWVLCIANRADVGLYDWHVAVTVGPPEVKVDEGHSLHGPIGPGGLVAIPLARLDPAASPAVDLTLRYRDEWGKLWNRGKDGLVEVSEDPAGGTLDHAQAQSA